MPVSAKAGLVPCGCDGCPCNLCHFFVLIDRIVDFLVLELVPIIATLMLVFGGVMFLFSAGNVSTIEKAKKIMTSAIFGLVIIFTAWLVINTFLMYIGVQPWTGLGTWWAPPCDPGCYCWP